MKTLQGEVLVMKILDLYLIYHLRSLACIEIVQLLKVHPLRLILESTLLDDGCMEFVETHAEGDILLHFGSRSVVLSLGPLFNITFETSSNCDSDILSYFRNISMDLCPECCCINFSGMPA